MKLFKVSMERRHMLEGYMFISPWLLGCLLFFAGPMFSSIRLSFSKLEKLTGLQMKWVGFSHYYNAFVLDVTFLPMFLNVISNTLIDTPLIMVFSLIIAILLNRQMKFRGFYRAAFFLPFILGTGFIMKELLGQGIDERAMEMARGILLPEEVLNYLGPMVTGPIEAFLSRITLVLWRSGIQILLFLGGLQSIPRSLYEAASCDSATDWQMFWKITLPMISPIMVLNAIFTLIESFSDSGNPIVTYIIDHAFHGFQFEYSAAVAWIYLLFVFLFVIAVFALMRVKQHYK